MSALLISRHTIDVPRGALAIIVPPQATPTWFPMNHGAVIDLVTEHLLHTGFQIVKSQFLVSRNGLRMFATLDLMTDLATGTYLAVGVRNANDKRFPLGFVAGSRVMVCDNLAFSGELKVASRHTVHGKDRFIEAVAGATKSLGTFREAESLRIKWMQNTPVYDSLAESVLLRAFEAGILSPRTLATAIREWRTPSYPEFAPRTSWSLYNAVTFAMKSRAASNPGAFAALTQQLGRLLS